MALHKFTPSNFFDLSDFDHATLFDNVENIWEVIPKIEGYVNGKHEVGEGTIIEEGAFVKGPVIIGKNCVIAHGAYIRENVIIGDHVKIGHGTEVKNSIVLSNTAVAHLNYIGDSIVGGDVNIGGGAKTANFRLDGQSIRVKAKHEEPIDTGLAKFGAIVGDGSKLGVNSVLNPGTVLGKNVMVYPLIAVFGVYGDGEIIK